MSEIKEIINKPSPELTEADVDKLIAGSFLRNVPMFLAQGATLDEAARLAFERDERMLIEMQIVSEKRGSHCRLYGIEEGVGEFIDALSKNIWLRANQEKIEGKAEGE